MDEINRVKNIKQRFENKDVINGKLVPKNFNNLNFVNHCTKSSNDNFNIIDSSNHRINIKRTPAFRRDKGQIRSNDEKSENSQIIKSSIVTNRVNHFNKLQNEENSRSQETDKHITKNQSKNGDILTSTYAVHASEALFIRKNHVKSNELKNEEQLPVYAKIKKPQRNAKTTTKSKKSVDESVISNKDSFDYRRIIKSKYATDGIKRAENSVNKENKKTFVYNKMSSDKINDDLSDTLKRVLRSPLPPGPPPKKPPRTFTAKPISNNNSTSLKCSNNAFIINDKNLNDRNECHFTSGIPRPIRSKTEPEIMLKKIENALLKHQKFALSANLNIRKPSYSLDSKPEKYAEINKSRRRTSDRGIIESSMPNSTLNPLDTNNAEQKTDSCSLNVHFSDTVVPSIRKEIDNHIYEDPNEIRTSQSSPTNEILTSSLYYMSTPIESIVHSVEMKSCNSLEEITNMNSKDSDETFFKNDSNIKIPNDISIENKIKTWMNDAYGKPCTKLSDGSSDSDSVLSVNIEDALPQSNNDINETEEYDQVTLKRKGYVQKIASKIISRRQSIISPFAFDYKYLFECLLLIGLDLDIRNNKVPYIKMKYPNNANVPQWIEHMCFPDAHDWSSTSVEKSTNYINERCYVVTLTTQAGQRKYVYCRRIKPEGESFSLPLSYCILSPHQAYEFYLMILEELENRHGQSEIKFKNFIKELHEHKFPTKGEAIKINTYSEDGNVKIKEELIERPLDTRVEDLRLARTLSYLKIDIFLTIFSSMLLERKIILLSSCISKLSTCIGGLQVALLPFHWQHTLVTVVPSNLISVMDLCEAPTPYLIGLLKSKNNPTTVLSSFNNKQQIVIVDLDEKKLLRKVGDENSILPNHLSKGIKNALQLAHSSEIRTNNLLACEAFTRLFVELVGHYRRYIIQCGNEFNQKKSFQKEAFIRAASPHSVRMFLEWFVETAAFSTFIELRFLHNSETKGLFEQRCKEYFDELNKQKYVKNKKIVKQIGDLIKDWTTAS